MPSLVDGNQGLALPVASDGPPRPGSGGPGSGRAPEAWLVGDQQDAGPLSDFDRLTLHQAVTIVALELLRARVAGDTERRLAGDVLDAVVTGELTGSELARRLGPFGLGDRVAAVVLRRSGPRGTDRARAPGPRRARSRRRCGARCARRPRRRLVASVGPLACALVPGGADEDLFALGERVMAAAENELRDRARVGIGRSVPAVDARRSFHEARCALEALAMGVAGNGDGNGSAPEPMRVATYKDLGSFQLLLAAGRRGPAAVLRLDPGPDRSERRPLRRRADALARGVHRGERPVGARGAAAVLSPPHAALPDPAGRGVDRAQPGLGPGPDRVLAGAARAAAGGMTTLTVQTTGRAV